MYVRPSRSFLDTCLAGAAAVAVLLSLVIGIVAIRLAVRVRRELPRGHPESAEHHVPGGGVFDGRCGTRRRRAGGAREFSAAFSAGGRGVRIFPSAVVAFAHGA